MSKHENKFLDKLQKGDKVFLVIYTRGNGDAWLGEVEYQSKKLTTYKYLWDEPKCVPSYVTDYNYEVKFKSDEKTFTVKFTDRGWNTEDALDSTSIELSDSTMLADDFHCKDIYLTTDIDKFKKFVNEKRLVETAISNLESKKSVIEKQLKRLFMYRSGTVAR